MVLNFVLCKFKIIARFLSTKVIEQVNNQVQRLAMEMHGIGEAVQQIGNQPLVDMHTYDMTDRFGNTHFAGTRWDPRNINLAILAHLRRTMSDEELRGFCGIIQVN